MYGGSSRSSSIVGRSISSGTSSSLRDSTVSEHIDLSHSKAAQVMRMLHAVRCNHDEVHVC